jgi:CubicO group peptidase (beta-lactamase class C family)
MAADWTKTWLPPIAVAGGLLITGLAAFITFISLNSKTLHPDPQEVRSTMASTPLPKWTDAVTQSQQLVRSQLAEQNLPGISVAVGIDGDIVWAEGFGWADLGSRVPVAPGTSFRIGHVSKALTSAAVGLLRQQGRLHLDAEIQEYVPAFPRKAWPVTLRQLMGNVAGVRHYRDTEWGDKPSAHCERASEGIPTFANAPLLFEPETQYRYSTYGWVLVSAAVEAAANEPFFTFMRSQVFMPLGMSDTGPDSANEPAANRVTSYYRQFESERTSDVDYSCFAGAGAFLSTPSDLVRFGLGRLHQGFGAQTGPLLKPQTVSMLQTRQQLRSGEETDYGLGWMLETVELAGQPTQLAGHASRTIEGASTSFLTFPERGLVVVVMANISFADPKSIALGIAEAFAKQRDGGLGLQPVPGR